MQYRSDRVSGMGYHPVGESAKGETRRGHRELFLRLGLIPQQRCYGLRKRKTCID
jgi:hypothetical protein